MYFTRAYPLRDRTPAEGKCCALHRRQFRAIRVSLDNPVPTDEVAHIPELLLVALFGMFGKALGMENGPCALLGNHGARLKSQTNRGRTRMRNRPCGRGFAAAANVVFALQQPRATPPPCVAPMRAKLRARAFKRRPGGAPLGAHAWVGSSSNSCGRPNQSTDISRARARSFEAPGELAARVPTVAPPQLPPDVHLLGTRQAVRERFVHAQRRPPGTCARLRATAKWAG